MTMPDAVPPRKPRYRWLVIPYLLVFLLAIAWCVAWFYGRSRVEAAMDAAQEADLARGYTLTWGSRLVGGFPFRYEVKLTDVRFAERSGWGMSAPKLEAVAAAYAPTRLVAVASEGVVVTRPMKGPLTVRGDVLRASFGGFPNQPRVSVEGVKLTFTPQAGDEPPAFAAAERFELHLRPQPADHAQMVFRIEEATPSPNTLLANLANGKASALRLEADLDKASALRGPDWPSALRRWSAAGGLINVRRGEAAVGDGLVRAEPTALMLDSAGRLQGPLTLSVSSGPMAILALGATGVLPPETASVAAGLTGATPSARVPLTFRDGQTWLGPLPIGRAPNLY